MEGKDADVTEDNNLSAEEKKPLESPSSGNVVEVHDDEDEVIYDLDKLTERIKEWSEKLKDGAKVASSPPPKGKPFAKIYSVIEIIERVSLEVDLCANLRSVADNPELLFWVRLTKIHVLSSLAKWREGCEEMSAAQEYHACCIELIEKELGIAQSELATSSTTTETTTARLSDLNISDDIEDDDDSPKKLLLRGKERLKFMYIYELTRFAILCSELDKQDQALESLKKAEKFYHDSNITDDSKPIKSDTILYMLDSLNSESAQNMFTYVLFYLGQAYKILEEKERAILYLHMVLRRQLEKGDYNPITWGSDSAKMAGVLMLSAQAFETARDILVAATTVMKQALDEEKSSERFKECWAELGRNWAKLGVNILECSSERLKDIQDEHYSRPIKFQSVIKFTNYEKRSLGITSLDEEYDTLVLLQSLKFPSLETTEVDQAEMKGKFARDFEEAREIFLCAQRWIKSAKKYYTLDEFASDYIDLTMDHVALYKHLVFFESCLERQIKMHKKRINLIEEVLAELNPKVYTDIFHIALRDLAETYEAVYKLKVDECKERGKSLRPKDKKLVQYLVDSVETHKRNLQLFGFDIKQPSKSFPESHEKIMLACVLSMARILGSICHDHPLHPDAIQLGLDGKDYYKFFLEYLDLRPQLKQVFRVLYEGSQDMPELLDSQVRKIRHYLRVHSTIRSEHTL